MNEDFDIYLSSLEVCNDVWSEKHLVELGGTVYGDPTRTILRSVFGKRGYFYSQWNVGIGDLDRIFYHWPLPNASGHDATRETRLVVDWKPPWEVEVPDDLVKAYNDAKCRKAQNNVTNAVHQLYGYMTFNNLEFSILCTYDSTFLFRRVGDSSLEVSPAFKRSAQGLESPLAAWIYICHLVLTQDYLLYSPINTNPSGQLEMRLDPNPEVQGTWDKGREVRWDRVKLQMDQELGKNQATVMLGQVMTDRRQTRSQIKPTRAVFKIYDITTDVKLRMANAEIAAYKKLERSQGVYVPKLYAAGTVWGMLKVLVLEDCGKEATRQTIPQDFGRKARRALSALHFENMLHGDLALRNFALSGSDVRLIDLGCCRKGSKYDLEEEQKELEAVIEGKHESDNSPWVPNRENEDSNRSREADSDNQCECWRLQDDINWPPNPGIEPPHGITTRCGAALCFKRHPSHVRVVGDWGHAYMYMMRDTTLTLALLALAPAVSLAQKSAGCGKAVAAADIGSPVGRNITSSSVGRSFRVRLPEGYQDGTAYPVLFGFHGSPGIGLYFELDTRFNEPQWGAGKILVYPDALNGTWATGAGGTPVEQDLEFVQDMVDELKDTYCVDTARIYATGISNGAGFINRIACDEAVGANFAAFAPSSGAYTGFEPGGNATCQPYKTPLPILSIHGGNDTTVPYNGRNASAGVLATPPIEFWLQGWVERNKCDNMTMTTINGTVHRFLWTCDGVDGAMEHWREDDMGHAWASREPTFSQIAAGEPPTKIEGNAVILDFFEEWRVDVPPPSSTTTAGPSSTSGAAGSETSAAGGGNAAGRTAGSLAMAGLGVAVAVLGSF
ncbi:hypothetical protein Dda_4320 [Drechslerella dactyloides]|uniref:feruloyl esterase n=1 Tax=Drechslerella dactyloides TaxID=74499 RepID=A0AAD6IWR3_DREDA|nr:hypothetical protein Dda_4320 [Drechslerella dactyloides]